MDDRPYVESDRLVDQESDIPAYTNREYLELATSELLSSDRLDIEQLAVQPFGDRNLHLILAWIRGLPKTSYDLRESLIARATVVADAALVWAVLGSLRAMPSGMTPEILHSWVSGYLQRQFPLGTVLDVIAQLSPLFEFSDGCIALAGKIAESDFDNLLGAQQGPSSRQFIGYAAERVAMDASTGPTPLSYRLDGLNCALAADDRESAAYLIFNSSFDDIEGSAAAWTLTKFFKSEDIDSDQHYVTLRAIIQAVPDAAAAADLACFFCTYLFDRNDNYWDPSPAREALYVEIIDVLVNALLEDPAAETSESIALASYLILIDRIRSAADLGSLRAGGRDLNWFAAQAASVSSSLPPERTDAVKIIFELVRSRMLLLEGRREDSSAAALELKDHINRSLSGVIPKEILEPCDLLAFPDNLPESRNRNPVFGSRSTSAVLWTLRRAQRAIEQDDEVLARSAAMTALNEARLLADFWPECGAIRIAGQFCHIVLADIAAAFTDPGDARYQLEQVEEVLRLSPYKVPTLSEVMMHLAAAARLISVLLRRSDFDTAHRRLPHIMRTLNYARENALGTVAVQRLGEILARLEQAVLSASYQFRKLSDEQWNIQGSKVLDSANLFGLMYRSCPGSTEWNKSYADALINFAEWTHNAGDLGLALSRLGKAAVLLHALPLDESRESIERLLDLAAIPQDFQGGSDADTSSIGEIAARIDAWTRAKFQETPSGLTPADIDVIDAVTWAAAIQPLQPPFSQDEYP